MERPTFFLRHLPECALQISMKGVGSIVLNLVPPRNLIGELKARMIFIEIISLKSIYLLLRHSHLHESKVGIT